MRLWISCKAFIDTICIVSFPLCWQFSFFENFFLSLKWTLTSDVFYFLMSLPNCACWFLTGRSPDRHVFYMLLSQLHWYNWLLLLQIVFCCRQKFYSWKNDILLGFLKGNESQVIYGKHLMGAGKNKHNPVLTENSVQLYHQKLKYVFLAWSLLSQLFL